MNIKGRGTTGRTTPNNLNEQMAMEQVKSNPLNGVSNTGITMGDTRWPSNEGWQKMQQVVTFPDGSKVTIHFNYTSQGVECLMTLNLYFQNDERTRNEQYHNRKRHT